MGVGRRERERRGYLRNDADGSEGDDSDVGFVDVEIRGEGGGGRRVGWGWGGGTGRPVTRGEMGEALEKVEESLRARLRVSPLHPKP